MNNRIKETVYGKILRFDNSAKRYSRLAGDAAEDNKPEKALGLFFASLKKKFSAETLADIGDVYADMGLFELSNRYWFKYMDAVGKDKMGIAAEELAINFFYLDNILASGHYFQKKASLDGYVKWDTIDPEIYEYFNAVFDPKKLYYVAYPENHRDYSKDIKEAKIAMSINDYDTAIRLYSGVSEESSFYDGAVEGLSLAYMMTGEFKKALTVNKRYMELKGENLTSLCNLSGIYCSTDDGDEKGKYYFEKARSFDDGNFEAAVKLAACAIATGDDVYAVEYINRVLDERPFAIEMRFFLGIALINLNRYDEATDEMSRVLRTDPDDRTVRFYLSFIRELKKGKKSAEKKLPLKYETDVPAFERRRREKFIKDIVSGEVKITDRTFFKTETREIIKWAIRKGDDEVARNALFILSTLTVEFSQKTVIELLMDPDLFGGYKEILVFILVSGGYKGKISLITSGIYTSFKPRKFPFENTEEGDYYLAGYATCLARLSFSDLIDYDKLAFATDRIYKKYNGKLTPDNSTRYEIAALIFENSKVSDLIDAKRAAGMFGIKEARMKQLLEIGKNDGKKN